MSSRRASAVFPAPLDPTAHARVRQAFRQLGPRARVHVSADMSRCYAELAQMYPDVVVFGYESGDRSGSWIAPDAWEVEGARLVGPDGSVVADWAVDPLTLFIHSPSFQGEVSREELERHLFSLEDNPRAVAFHFRNQYRHWSTDWGFCLRHEERQLLEEGTYQVDIRCRYEPGQMEMAEQVLQGDLPDSLLLVGHFDHPYQVIDGLTGCIAGHEALTRLKGRKTKLTYRMLSTVEIVGSVFYAERCARENSVREALFVASSGADAPLSYATSFRGTAAIDRVMRHLLPHVEPRAEVFPFRKADLGNDEIAFDVRGVDIPCGSIMRAPIPNYHTHFDNVQAVDYHKFEAAVTLLMRAINVLERNSILSPRFVGLPCLSHPDIDLYISVSAASGAALAPNHTTRHLLDSIPREVRDSLHGRQDDLAYMMIAIPIMADGTTTVLDIAERCGLPFEVVDSYTDMWEEKGLLSKEWVHPFQSHC